MTTVGAYRVWQPLNALVRAKKAEARYFPITTEKMMYALASDSPNYDERMGCWADDMQWCNIALYKSVSTKVQLATVMAMQDQFKKPYVVDVDDDMFAIRKSNPNYSIFQEKTIDQLEDAHTITKEQIEEYAAKDYTVYELPNNLGYVATKVKAEMADRNWTQVLIKNANGVICQSEHLAKVYKHLLGPNAITYVIPNYMDLTRWEGRTKIDRNDGYVNVGYFGSTSHYEDILLIKDLIDQLLTEFPTVRFIFGGSPPPYLGTIFNKWKTSGRFIVRPWDRRPQVDVEREWYGKVGINVDDFTYDGHSQGVLDWERYFTDLSFDISLAPLVNDAFNAGKSNIKWMEAAMLKTPTVASDAPVYSCIKHGTDGYLASNYKDLYKFVTRLVKDKGLRDSIGNTVYERVVKEYNLDDHVDDYVNVFEDAIRRHNLRRSNILIQSSGKEKVE